MPQLITEVQLQRKKKSAKGETRAAVDNAKLSLKAAGKKRKTTGTTRYVHNIFAVTVVNRLGMIVVAKKSKNSFLPALLPIGN
jgi:hypothetical protein